jgi:cohesin loading factor subunit SCC2
VTALEDSKPGSAASNDSNGAKSASLDHLGTIAAKLRATVLKYKQTSDNESTFSSLDEVGKQPSQTGVTTHRVA